MGRKRNRKRNKKLKNGKMKMSNSNTNKQNEKPERTDDSGTSSEDDREDSTQHLSLEEAEKNKSDHDMSPNEKEGREMEALGENNGNDNDDHGGKKPFETPRSEVCEVENLDRRNNHLRNNVKKKTESNNEQSTSEEGKSIKAEISTKSDDANKIEITVTSGAKSDDVDPSPQSFQTSETERNSIDTEEQHRDNNTIKIEKGKQADHNRVDERESQTEHMNMDVNQQNAEDGERTNDIAMTQSNNDQTTPEEDQPKHMERRTETIGVNGEKTVVSVSPLQSFQTGHIKDDQMDGTEGRHQHGHVDGTEERHQHVDGTEEQHQHRHVNSDVEQQNGQVDNDSNSTEVNNKEDKTMSPLFGEKTAVNDSPLQSLQTGHIKDDQINGTEEQHQHGNVDHQNGQVDNDSTNTEADNNEHEPMSHVNGEKTAVDDSPSQSFQTGDIKHDEMDGTEVQQQHGHVDGTEERHQHGHVDGTEERHQHEHVVGTGEQAQQGPVGVDVDQQNRQIDNDSTNKEADNNEHETMSHVNGEKTAVDNGPSQSLQTGHIKHDEMDGAEVQQQRGHLDGTEERHQHGHVGGAEVQQQHGHVDGEEEQAQHGPVDMDVDQQNRQVDNDSTNTEADNNEHETMSHVNGEKTAVDDGPSQSFQTGDIKHDEMDGTEVQQQHGHVDGTEELHQHEHVDGTEVQAQHGPVDMDVDQQNRQVDNDSTNTKADNNEHETMSHVNGEKTTVDVGPSQSFQTGDIKHDQMDGTEVRHQHGHVDGTEERHQHGRVDGTEEWHQHRHVDGTEEQPQHRHVDGTEVQCQHMDGTEEWHEHGHVDIDVDQQYGQVDNDSTSSKAENNEDVPMSLQSSEDGTGRGSDETPSSNASLNPRNKSRGILEEDTSIQPSDVVREPTVVVSDAKSGDDSPSQSFQNENIEHDNINSEEMQRSASLTTIDSPNSSITTTHVQEQPFRAFGDDAGDPGLRNGELSLYENETENDNVVNADNFENEMDSPQSSESGNDMAHYEGSNEILGYNLLSDIQLKTSQEKEIEKLQRELNIKNENLVTLQEEMKRRDEIINEKNSENADLLHRCVASETSAEAADDLREQCEDKNHQIETLGGDLAFLRNENESLKRHLEEIENVAAYHQRLIDENKSLNEYLEQERQSSAALKEEAQALKEQITNKEDVLKELESQIKKAIEEKEELGAKLASRNENSSDLLSKYLEMKKKDEEMAAELKKMQENYQYEKRRSEELSGELNLKNKEVTTTVNKYKQEMEELKAKYKTEKDQAEKEKELLKQGVTKLTEGSQQLQAENKRIKDDLQLKLMECGNLKSERLRITGELDAAKKEIAELSNDRDKLGAYITTVNDEVRQLRAALELKEAEKNAANECMQKVVREKQEMMYSMGNLQRIELENHQLKRQNMGLSEQITKLHASLQEYGLLRDHIQEYYKAFQDSQMELEREKEKSRHINELLSKTGYRLDSMASELNNYRTMTEGYRRSLEEEKEKSNKLERKLDRLTIDNEKLTEERDKCEQKSFEYKDECRSLREDLEKSQAECRDLLSQTQEGASDGTTSLLQGNYFTSTPMGNGFGKPSSQSNFAFGIGGDKMNRKK